MSILLMEGFGWLETGTRNADEFYGVLTPTGNSCVVSDDFPGTGRKGFSARGLPSNCYMDLDGSSDTIFMGCRVMFPATYGINMFQFVDQGVGVLLHVHRMADNSIGIYRRNYDAAGTLIGQTGALGTSTWYHLAFEIVFHDTNGVLKLWVDGNLEIDYTGDTIYLGTECDQLNIGGGETANATNTVFTDMWVDDAVNHGDCYVTYEPCDQAGSSADWTPLSGNNEDNVDEVGPDEDTTYNESNLNGDLDQLGSSNVAALVGGPIAVQAHAVARKTSPGTYQVKLGMKSGATHTQEASDWGLSDAYQAHRFLREDVPGGSGWSQSEAQGVEISIENTS